MPTAIAWVIDIAAPDPYDVLTITGRVSVLGIGPASAWTWTAYVPYASTDAQYGAACLTAAVAVAAANGVTIAPEDTKRLFGSSADSTIGAQVTTAAGAAANAQTTANSAATAASAAQTTANAAAASAATAQASAATSGTSASTAIAAAAAAQASATTAANAAAAAVQQPVAGSTVSLALNTSRQPNATRGTRVTAYGTWAWNLTAIGSATGTATLASDSNSTPTTTRGLMPFTRGIGVGITVADSGTLPWSMSYDVPAGHYYRVNSSGTGIAIGHINETPL